MWGIGQATDDLKDAEKAIKIARDMLKELYPTLSDEAKNILKEIDQELLDGLSSVGELELSADNETEINPSWLKP